MSKKPSIKTSLKAIDNLTRWRNALADPEEIEEYDARIKAHQNNIDRQREHNRRTTEIRQVENARNRALGRLATINRNLDRKNQTYEYYQSMLDSNEPYFTRHIKGITLDILIL